MQKARRGSPASFSTSKKPVHQDVIQVVREQKYNRTTETSSGSNPSTSSQSKGSSE